MGCPISCWIARTHPQEYLKMTDSDKSISVDLVRAALRSEDIPSDLTIEQLNRSADRYERFLKLCAKHSEQQLVPTHDIDIMWHLHMLHPRAYYSDCMSLFGTILDHDGGFGSRPDERPALESAFADTSTLWNAEYGEEYSDAEFSKSCRSDLALPASCRDDLRRPESRSTQVPAGSHSSS